MRLIFAGTPEFARVALAGLRDAGHEIVLVLTQPDRPAGRGMKLQPSAVKQFATWHDLPVAQPRGLRLDGKFAADATAARDLIGAARAEAMVVAAYGLILPQWALDLPALGCLNIHASLLPRWRGAAPIHRAIEAGDAETGVAIMQMDAGLDTGAVLLEERVQIAPNETSGSLHDRLAALGGRLIVQALDLAERGQLPPRPQAEAGATYARKIEKHEATIDWSEPALVIERRIRAFDPFPGATLRLGDSVVKVWRAEAVAESDHRPQGPSAGTVLSADARGIRVACSEGVLRITELQRAGAKRMAAADFLRGFSLPAGSVLG